MFVERGLPRCASRLTGEGACWASGVRPPACSEMGQRGDFIAEVASKQGRARLVKPGHASRSRGSCDWLANLSFLCLKPFLFFWLRKRVMHANNRNEKKKFLRGKLAKNLLRAPVGLVP